MQDDFEQRTQRTELGPQPDPMLKEHKANSMWVWLIGVVVAGVVVAVLFGLSEPTPNTASMGNQPAPATTGSNAPPQSTMPASRDNSNATLTPPVTQPSGQNPPSTTGSGNSAPSQSQ